MRRMGLRGDGFHLIYMIPACIFLLIITIWLVKTYNKFIMLDERIKNGKAQIAAQVESRWDAINSLISATKNYAQYEGETLENIIDKRTSVGKDSSIREIEKNNEELGHVMSRLLAISENYPELKASEVFQKTMKTIDQYEEKVRHSRMIYNDVVTKYNRLVKSIPTNFVAKSFSFTSKQYFQSTDGKEEAPSWD